MTLRWAVPALLLLAAAPLCAKTSAPRKHPAQSADKKAPPRTLSQVIDAVLQRKINQTLTEPMASQLGFAGPTPAYALQISKTAAPDHCEHAVRVMTKESEKAVVAREIIVSKTCIRGEGASRTVEGNFFRCSPSGDLIAALHLYMAHGHVTKTKWDAGSKKTKRELSRELNDILVKYASLPFTE